MRGLTRKQRAILRFIQEHVAANGWAPTLREIALAHGFTSTNAVSDHLNALERKGYIERGDHIARAIRVVRPLDHEARDGK